MIVVDTNVMVGLTEGRPDATLLFEQDPEWAAPAILMSELCNVLLGNVRRGTIDSDEAKAMSDDAATVLGDRVGSVASTEVIDTALECGLTSYDAEFVVLARKLGVPLATGDNAILQGASDVAFTVRDMLG